MMLPETAVLRRNHRVLQVERNVWERNELVALLVSMMRAKGLYPALHLNCGGPRIDPAQQYDADTAQDVQPYDQRHDSGPDGPQQLWLPFHLSLFFTSLLLSSNFRHDNVPFRVQRLQ